MRHQPLKLPFGMRDGVLLHVGEVAQGAACDCTCPGCGSLLIAKKGTRKVHHFAHASAECSHGVETALHLAAKAAIESAGELLLPAVRLEYRSHNHPWTIAEPQLVRPDAVRVETRLAGIVPDIILTVSGRDLLVEVCVTHAVDEAKLAKIQALGLSVLEISIGHLPRDFPMAELRSEVVYGRNNRKWLYNTAAVRLTGRLIRLSRSLPHVHRGMALHVDNCPVEARVWKGKAYANVIDDCIACQYCFDTGLGEGGSAAVACLGHTGVSTYDEYREKVRSSAAREA